MTNKPFYILGDTHGQWEILFRKIKHNDIKDCILFHVGDVGIGYSDLRTQKRLFTELSARFAKRNIDFMAIRGNHDDPSYFAGQFMTSNFKLLPDYSTLEINGQKVLAVGGATSIDRTANIPYVSWWPNEKFVLQPESVTPCDVLITHTAPHWIGPCDKSGLVAHFCAKDETLWDECVAERLAMSELVKLSKAKKHYCGHFHTFTQVEHGGCLSCILNEFDIIEHRPPQNLDWPNPEYIQTR